MKVAFVGLGVMGFPMAGHLAKAGHEVSVYNRSPDKALRWVDAHGGRAGDTLHHATHGAELVALCVGNDDDVRGVVAEILQSMAEGGIIVDHTTTSAKVAREMAELAEATGRTFLDAPVSGGQAGAENGQLTIMVGGDEAALARAEPVIGAYAKAIKRIGGPGHGQLAKMANQICIAGVVQGLAEAVHFCAKAGVDPQNVFDAISKGAAQSWQMDNRWATMVQGKFDFGFAVDWMRKDLGIAMAEGKRQKAGMPLVALVDQFYERVQARGGGRWDTSSLIQPLQKP
jgi:3-hydroxyisobutyrate dehydrogenase